MSIFLTTFHGNRCKFVRHIVIGTHISVFILKNSSSRSIKDYILSEFVTGYNCPVSFVACRLGWFGSVQGTCSD